jgi:arylsulfatase A-like enzyme
MARNCTIVVAGLLVACAGHTGCARTVSPPSGVVIFTLDTTRADRLAVYGFGGVATPTIDTLAGRGVVFDDAETVAPLTLPAHTSLFTGLYPPHHGVRDNTGAPLEPAHATLAEILHARGFHTGAFVGSAVLAADRGLSRGFDVYDDGGSARQRVPHRRPGSDVVDRANAWIHTLDGDAPFFLWVHLYDVHAPQVLPMEFRRAYGDGYEGGIAYVDGQIGRVLDALRGRGMLDRAAVVIAGDHGESLGEHGEKEHGRFVYESTMHVPLVIVAPGLTHGRSSVATSLVDVLPTVLDLFGIPAAVGDGHSRLKVLRGARPVDGPIYGESMYPLHFGSRPLRMIRDGRFKYIEAAQPELYDLQTDRSEMHNLAPERPSVAAVLAGVLRDGLDASEYEARAGALDPERRQMLAALGYASGR